MTDDPKERLEKIKTRYQKLGWLPREDLLRLMAELEKQLNEKG